MPTQRACCTAAATVFLAVIVLYFPTLRGGFVYDSIAQVLYSDYIHTPSHWVDVLTLRVVGADELDRNRPMHLASLMLDAAMWGKNPFGYRLTSAVLHALNAALLCALIAILLARQNSVAPSSSALIACFGALVFALHPLVVEAVAEPSNREDLLVLLPMLVGLLFVATDTNREKFRLDCRGGSRRPGAISQSVNRDRDIAIHPGERVLKTLETQHEQRHSPMVLNAVLILASLFAVLAKESGVAVPFVFAVACWLSGCFRRCWPGIAGGFFAVAAFLLASYAWRPRQSGVFVNCPAPLAQDWLTFVLVQARIWTLQLQQIVWPSNLSAHYPPEVLGGISSALAIALLALVAAAAVFFSWKNRLVALGVAIFVLGLLPASNFLPQFHPIADRYLYVPLAGLGMIVAAAFAWLRSQYSSALAGVALVVLGVALLSPEYSANLQRQKVWQAPAALWTDVLQQYPNLAQAHIGMANAHFRADYYEAALASAQEAVRTSSGYWADPYAIRAVCEWQTGRHRDALVSCGAAQKLSRAYASEASMKAALFMSPGQIAVWREILAAQ